MNTSSSFGSRASLPFYLFLHEADYQTESREELYQGSSEPAACETGYTGFGGGYRDLSFSQLTVATSSGHRLIKGIHLPASRMGIDNDAGLIEAQAYETNNFARVSSAGGNVHCR
jgi:hypothetical protein